jgi:hypothetical protein
MPPTVTEGFEPNFTGEDALDRQVIYQLHFLTTQNAGVA